MKSNSLLNLTVAQLRRAATLREKISKLEKELGAIVGEVAPSKAGKDSKDVPEKVKGKGKKRKMSPEGRERIAAAQRERWRKVHQTGK
jgi:hypothetical protein